jgi:hypothetical protein
VPDTKISAETAASALSGPETFPAVQSAGNVKVTATQIKAFAKAGLAPSDLTNTVSTQSGTSYTAVLGDAGTYIQFTNGSSITFTIPPNSSVAFPIGTVIEMEQNGAGALTLAPGSGVTINSRGADLTLAGQYAVAAVKKVATNIWTLAGDL